ncbi:MAG: hypothetical protein HY913_18465 [Desulfomonile tiedjei]|nr:hypothetical protein [Desulfomonile tiedjei]
MKRRGHISTFICLLIIASSLAAVAVAGAQEFIQPPFVPSPPGTPTLMAGRFYFQAGVRYRSVESLRFDVSGGPQTLTFAAGTPLFGPLTSGNFGVGTGREGFTGTNGPAGDPLRWLYDNGYLSGPVDPAPGVQIGCAGPPAVAACGPADQAWTYITGGIPTPELGRQTFFVSSANCCNGLIVPGHIGSFSLNDATVQVDNPNSIVGTTQVTLQVILDDSLAFLVNTTPDINRQAGPKLWSPTFEAGYQLYNYFDIFYGFSWFNVDNSVGLSNVIPGQVSRTLIIDTFPFVSDHDSAWPVGSFFSSDNIIGDTPAHIYQVTPNSPLRGIFPNRQFSTQLDDSIPAESIQETVSARADISVYETRIGGRSWVPLYGLGRIGVTLGTAFMPTYYKLIENRSYTALGPNLPPGTPVFAISNEIKDWRAHYGAFVGSDLELGYGAAYVKGSVDYMWANALTYQLDAVNTSFNPGGMTLGINGGIHF